MADRRELPALAHLVGAIQGARLARGDPTTRITGICHDTRRLSRGELFVAIRGFRSDGREFVGEAVARGAGAVAAEADIPTPDGVALVLVPSARAAVADLAAAFFGHPSRRMSVVGVTGTDGKTSTVHMLSAILEAHGLRTGWLSTVSTKVGERVRPNASEHTTPEAPVVQATLAEMVEAGTDVAIVETSSHALALDRVRGIEFRVGVFTNVTPEHINFHGSFDAYRATKGRLLAALPPDGLAVLNADDPSSAYMRSVTRAPTLTYALDGPADLRATDVAVAPGGTRFTIRASQRRRRAGRNGVAAGTRLPLQPVDPLPLRTRLIGRFNAANWLAAYGAATYFGATAEDLARAVAQLGPVLGRMNLIDAGQPFHVVVDFAHTPHALEHALEAARRLARGRVLLVFGLPGRRDPRSRSMMGWLATRGADFFAITTDDPFDEDPAEIAHQIAHGAELAGAAPGAQFVVDLDRRSALRMLLQRAEPGDVILLAGHGHLDHLVLGDRKLPWNDAQVAAEELRALGYRSASG